MLARVFPGATVATLATLVALTSPAAARLYDREPPRLEAGLEVAFALVDADPNFNDLEPGVLFGIAAGVHVIPDVRAGLVLRAAITDPHSEHYEALADLTWSWVGEPRLPDPPAVRAALSFELGWRYLELVGSGFVVTDHSIVAGIGAELGLVVFEDVALSLQASLYSGVSSNPVLSDLAPKLRAGVCFAILL